MLARQTRFIKISALVALLLLGSLWFSPAWAVYLNGQKASLVLGQPDFVSNASVANQNQISLPNDIAIDPVSKKVFVADPGSHRVLRFGSIDSLTNGASAEIVLGQPNFNSFNPTTSASGMFAPSALALDSAGRLWVADYYNHRVLRFDNAATIPNAAIADGVLGQDNFNLRISGTAQNRMYYPMDLSIDNNGTLWVADQGNNRVLRFNNAASKNNGANADGVLGQTTFTSNSSGSSQNTFMNPSGVAADNKGTLWVVDNGNNRVLRFNNAASKANGANADGVLGQVNFSNKMPGTSQNTLASPHGAALDSNGSLWVSDTNNHRVVRFDNAASKPNGANADGVLGQSDFSSNTASVSQTSLNIPLGVTVDNSGGLWVADGNNKRVVRFKELSSQKITFASIGNKTIGDSPFAIAASSSSNLAVSFGSATPKVCIVSNNTVTLLAVGTCTINANQAGDDLSYLAAPQVQQSFTVQAKATPQPTPQPKPSPQPKPTEWQTFLPRVAR